MNKILQKANQNNDSDQIILEKERFNLADACVKYMSEYGWKEDIYSLMMFVLNTKTTQDKWANLRGHKWDSRGKFIWKGRQ